MRGSSDPSGAEREVWLAGRTRWPAGDLPAEFGGGAHVLPFWRLRGNLRLWCGRKEAELHRMGSSSSIKWFADR